MGAKGGKSDPDVRANEQARRRLEASGDGIQQEASGGRESAGNGDVIGEEDVGHGGNRNPQVMAGALDQQDSNWLAVLGSGNDIAKTQFGRQPRLLPISGSDGGRRDKSFGAASSATRAERAIGFDDYMADVAETTVGKAQRSAIDAHTGAETRPAATQRNREEPRPEPC